MSAISACKGHDQALTVPYHAASQGAQTYSEKPGHKFTLNQSWDAVNANTYDALVIPGCVAPLQRTGHL